MGIKSTPDTLQEELSMECREKMITECRAISDTFLDAIVARVKKKQMLSDEEGIMQLLEKEINYDKSWQKIAEQKNAEKVNQVFIKYYNDTVVPASISLINQLESNAKKSFNVTEVNNIFLSYLSKSNLEKSTKDKKLSREFVLNKDVNNEIIEKEQRDDDTDQEFISSQDFRTYLTDAQKNKLNAQKRKYSDSQKEDFSTCYYRNKTGLAAFRHHRHTVKNNKGERELLNYWFHASPVPRNKLLSFEERMEITQQNLIQLGSNIIRKEPDKCVENDQNSTFTVPITEIRLLSPLNEPFNYFDSEQEQFSQILETYMAIILTNGVATKDTINGRETNFKLDTQMANYGINSLRKNHHELQNFINNRFLNETLEKILQKYHPNHQFGEQIKCIQQQRKGLADKFIKDCGKFTDNEKKLKENFLKELKKQDKNEKELYKKLSAYWQNEKNILDIKNFLNSEKAGNYFRKDTLKKISHDFEKAANDLDTVFRLLEDDLWAEEEYNGHLQATLIRLSSTHGRVVAVGCNDAKDRAGRVGMIGELQLIYSEIFGNLPKPISSGLIKIKSEYAKIKSDYLTRFRNLENIIYKKSSHTVAAGIVSALPHCELHKSNKIGLLVSNKFYKSDGTDHLFDPLSSNAKIVKSMMNISRKAKIKNIFGFKFLSKGLSSKLEKINQFNKNLNPTSTESKGQSSNIFSKLKKLIMPLGLAFSFFFTATQADTIVKVSSDSPSVIAQGLNQIRLPTDPTPAVYIKKTDDEVENQSSEENNEELLPGNISKSFDDSILIVDKRDNDNSKREKQKLLKIRNGYEVTKTMLESPLSFYKQHPIEFSSMVHQEIGTEQIRESELSNHPCIDDVRVLGSSERFTKN